MSFTILHAYVIEALDTHPCHVSEYVHDFNDNSDMVSISLKLSGTATVINAPTKSPTNKGMAISFNSVPNA